MFSEQSSLSSVESDLRRIKLLNYKIREYQLEQVWNRFESAGFKPLLIKGWAAAQYYSDPSERQFADVDLVINPKEFNRAEQFLKGLEVKTSIDLHNGTRQLDTLPFEQLYANSLSIKCGNTVIRVPRPEDHLRILCVHWLVDGGAKKDKLWDIYYAVKNRPAGFNWDDCLNVISQTRRRWIVCTIGLAVEYLDLSVISLPFAEEVKEIPRWLTKAVEKEWESKTILVPIHFVLNDPREFWRQLRKRIPPNPIQATVEMEGEFDNKSRVFYQVGDFLYRCIPSLKRILKRFKTPVTIIEEAADDRKCI